MVFNLHIGNLTENRDISSSQQNFFRMLDKKIEEGPDYDSSSETEIALEEARLNALVQHWESASITASICSSGSRSLQTTPVRQVPPVKQLDTPHLIIQTHIPIQQQQQQQQQQQFLVTNDYIAHGMSLPIVGPISKQQQLSSNQTQQQLYTKMLQQQAISNMGMNIMMGGTATGGMNINNLSGLSSESTMPMTNVNNSTTATTITSINPSNNGLALLQPTSTNGGIIGIGLGVGGNNISPKRTGVDGILLISGNNHSQQQQQQQNHQHHHQQQQQQLLMQLQHQYNNSNFNNTNSNTTTTNSILAKDFTTSASTYVNGGRSPQHLTASVYQQQQQQQQLAAYEYYGQQLHDQQQQQQQHNLLIGSAGGSGSGIAYYGEMTSGAGSTLSASIISATPSGSAATTVGTGLSQTPQPPMEYRFPPAISVQRLAPQVQRQLRETQELIKDSCPQMYATDYGSPGPPIRNPASRHLATTRRPTLETQFSQELS